MRRAGNALSELQSDCRAAPEDAARIHGQLLDERAADNRQLRLWGATLTWLCTQISRTAHYSAQVARSPCPFYCRSGLSVGLHLGSLTPAGAPLIDAENPFKQPGPPQFYRRDSSYHFLRCGRSTFVNAFNVFMIQALFSSS